MRTGEQHDYLNKKHEYQHDNYESSFDPYWCDPYLNIETLSPQFRVKTFCLNVTNKH